MAKVLHGAGLPFLVLDDLSGGYRDVLLYGEFIQGSIADEKLLDDLFSRYQFDAVMHFAAFIEVGESVRNPAKYYRNNAMNTQVLLEAMIKNNIKNFVFSSSAAVFGEPERIPIDESHPKEPVNPYGRCKRIVEQMLSDYEKAYDMQYVNLRYFNAAGADPDGKLGERHEPETHLIPLVLQAASGRRESISVFGTDYNTSDGTCIRDFIHVMDLCDAHLLALDRLLSGKGSGSYNLGNGNSFSVRQVIETARHVTGKDIKVLEKPRRPGDPAQLVADSRLARQELNWSPLRAEMEKIIEDTWRWECFLSKTRQPSERPVRSY